MVRHDHLENRQRMLPSCLPNTPDLDPDAPEHQKPWRHNKTAPSGNYCFEI